MQKAYGFKDEATLDLSIDGIRKTQGRNTTGPVGTSLGQSLIFAEVTEIVDNTGGKRAKGIQKVFSGDVAGSDPANSPDYDDMAAATPWTFDSDKLGEDKTTTDIISPLELTVGETIPVIPYPDKTNEYRWYALKVAAAGVGVKLYQVITANYAGDPITENIYTAREVSSYFYTPNPVSDPEDVEARVSGEGYPFGLVPGKVYENFVDVGGVVNLKAPELFPVEIDGGGFKLYDSHQGTELMAIPGTDIEVESLPTVDLDKFDGVWRTARWDEIREKLVVYIPTL